MLRCRPFVSLLFALTVSVPALAQTTTWLGDQSSSWQDPRNWSAGVPTGGSIAIIEVGGRFNAVADNALCDTLVVRAGAYLIVNSMRAREVQGAANSEIAYNGQLEVGGPYDHRGSIGGTGRVRLTGSGTVNGCLPSVEVASNRTFVDVDVQGSLTQSSGTLAIARTNVQGVADFAGTTVVSASSTSYLILGSGVGWHVAGQVTDPPKTIDVYGNWTTDPGDFAAGDGVVVFKDRTDLSGTCRFHDITVEASAQLDLRANVAFAGSARIDGQVTTSSSKVLTSEATTMDERISGSGSIAFLTLFGAVARSKVVLSGVTIARDLELVFSPDVTVEGTVHVRRDVLIRQAAHLKGTKNAHLFVDGACECGGYYELEGVMQILGDVRITASATVTPVQGRIVFKAPGIKTLSSTALNNPMPATVEVERGATLNITSVQNFGDLLVDGTVNVNDWSSGMPESTFARRMTVGSTGTLHYADTVVPFRVGDCRIDGTATLRGPVSTFAGDIVVNGVLTLDANASVRFEGEGVASGTFPQATVAGTDRAFDGATITGGLTHTAGVLRFGVATVGGGLTCRGTALAGSGGTEDLTVGGDLVVATTSPTTDPPAIIRARRNWQSSPTFRPASGLVLFEANPSHNARGTAGNDVTWFDMQVGTANALFLDGDLLGHGFLAKGQLTMSGDRVDLTGDLGVQAAGRCGGSAVTALRLGGRLDVAGTVDLPRAVANVRGNYRILDGGRVTIGAGVHLGGAGMTIAPLGSLGFGPASTFVFEGSGTIAVPASLVLPAVDIASPGTYVLQSLAVAGNLQHRPGSGRLGIGMVAVGGSALLLGGLVADAAAGAGVLDVSGGVLMGGAGVVPGEAPEIRCGAEFAATRSFAPTSNKVVMTGVVPALSRLRAVQGEIRFHDLELRGPVTTVDLQRLVLRTCRVAAGGGLFAPSAELTLRCDALQCDGTVAVPVGGRLVLGPNANSLAAVDIGATGRLWVVGDAGRPARIHGTGLGSYALTVAGSIEAAEFEFRDMNAAGVRILQGATIGPAPFDLRGGVFGSGASGPGSVLLDVARSGSQPLTLHGLVFDNRDHATRHNVRTLTTTPILLTASDGNFYGERFEADPNGVIDWVPFTRTELQWIGAEGGLNRVDLRFRSITEVDAQALGVLRGTSPNGPFDQVAGIVVPAGAPRTYAIVDRTAEPLRQYHYELVDAHGRGVLRGHGVRAGRSYPAAFGPVRVVGATGYASISAALAGAAPGTTVLVEGGTYPAFRVTVPVAIRPLPGARVQIDASAAPVSVDAVAGPVALHDLEIDATSGVALLVRRTAWTVVLDGLGVRGSGPASTAVIEDCPQVVLQWCGIAGGATRLTRSVVCAWGGDIADLRVLDRSRLVDAELSTGRVSVDSTSTRDALAGIAPRLSGSPVWRDSGEGTVELATNPADLYVVLYSLGSGWYDLRGAYFLEMVMALGLEALQQPLLVGQADAQGRGRLTVPVPAAPALWGLPLNLQALSVGVRFPPGRFSSLHRVVLLP